MPPKKTSTGGKKKKVESITAVELVDESIAVIEPPIEQTPTVVEPPIEQPPITAEPISESVAPAVLPPSLPEVKELQADPAELEEIVVVGDFKEPVKHVEPDDIRDAAGDADEAFNFPPPDSEPIAVERRPEWLKYEQDNPLFDQLRARRTDIQENQFKLLVPSHTLRAMEDSDVEADIGDMV